MHVWTVTNLKFLLYDQELLKYNVVQSIEWSVSKTEGQWSVERHGEVTLPSPSENFIVFEDIPEATAINWAKNAIGAEEVAAIEADLDLQLAVLVTPTHGSGRPWADGGV